MNAQTFAAASTKILIALAGFAMSGQLLAQEWKAPPTAVHRPNPIPVNANTVALGGKLYAANCLMCHGASGRGDGPGGAALEKKPADLGARIRSTGESDGELFWKISEGKSPMVSWKSLSETQRWELVNYIRTFAGK